LARVIGFFMTCLRAPRSLHEFGRNGHVLAQAIRSSQVVVHCDGMRHALSY